MKRDVALMLLGAWLLGIVAMAVVATQNFYTIDRLLDARPHAGFARGVDLLDRRDEGGAREFLRYLSSELNRLYFMGWGVAQIAIGALLVWLVRGLGDGRLGWTVLAMWALTLVLTIGLTPPIVSVGRALDFVPREPRPPELTTFGLLHAGYTIGEGLKLIMGLVAAYGLMRAGRKE